MKASASASVRDIPALERALIRQPEKLATLKRPQPAEQVGDDTLQTATGTLALADGMDGWEPQYRHRGVS